MAPERQPVRDHRASEKDGEHEPEGERDDDVSKEVPAPPVDHDHDDERRERKRGDERRPPERLGPPEHRDHVRRGLLVLGRRRVGCSGREPGRDGRDREQDPVDRPPIPPSALVGREQANGSHGPDRPDRLSLCRSAHACTGG